MLDTLTTYINFLRKLSIDTLIRDFSLSLVVYLIIIAFLLFWRKKRTFKISQLVCFTLLYFMLVAVAEVTVFGRPEMAEHQVQLQVLWSWKVLLSDSYAADYLKTHITSYPTIGQYRIYLCYEIFGNILMLFPIGFLIPPLLNRKLPFKIWLFVGALTGLLLSSSIEFSQLIFKRGLFEIDDIIHNTLGCIFGVILCSLILKKLKQTKVTKNE